MGRFVIWDLIKKSFSIPDQQNLALKNILLNTEKVDSLYTTIRTVGGTRLLEIGNHSKRLTKVHQQDEIQKAILQMAKEIIPLHRNEQEYRMTIVLEDDKLIASAEPIPQQPASVQIEMKNFHRNDPSIKYVKWLQDRKILEETKRPESNEVILVDAEGRIYEGLSSNFFAILQDETTLICAPEGAVLKGTILQIVVEMAPKLNIQVKREFPREDQLASYKHIFITSTSRLILPVEKVIDSKEKIYQYHPQHNLTLIKKIQNQLDQELLMRSTPFS